MENKNIDMVNNVIDEIEYKERLSLVFDKVASILKSTYGPYGCNTVIQKSTDVMFTKDGHQTMKRIKQNIPTIIRFYIRCRVDLSVCIHYCQRRHHIEFCNTFLV